MKDKEFWRVEIHSKKNYADSHVYHVFATSATQAEKRALELAKQNSVEKPYCYSATFVGYIR